MAVRVCNVWGLPPGVPWRGAFEGVEAFLRETGGEDPRNVRVDEGDMEVFGERRCPSCMLRTELRKRVTDGLDISA